MDQCCWYKESTCCDATVGNRFVLPKVREELRTVAGIVSPRMLFRFLSSHRRSCVFAGGDCFLAIADFLCLACSPTIGNYVQVRIERSFWVHDADRAARVTQKVDDIEYTLQLCGSFCDQLWSACSSEKNISQLFPTAPQPAANADDL